jgi:hypothetical protein
MSRPAPQPRPAGGEPHMGGGGEHERH